MGVVVFFFPNPCPHVACGCWIFASPITHCLLHLYSQKNLRCGFPALGVFILFFLKRGQVFFLSCVLLCFFFCGKFHTRYEAIMVKNIRKISPIYYFLINLYSFSRLRRCRMTRKALSFKPDALGGSEEVRYIKR